jgi:probable HAF family extracellular repeat protein
VEIVTVRRLASLLVILSPVVGCFWDRVIGPGDIEEVIDLGTLGGWESKATDINDLGQVVGSGERHAFLWQDGTMTDLGTLGGRRSNAAAINDLGQVVGTSKTGAGEPHAFLWQDGTMTDLGTLGGRFSHAADINDLGQVVGTSTTGAGRDHAFLWQDGAMTDLGTLEGSNSTSHARGINNQGQVVGLSAEHAFLWQSGTMTDLDWVTWASAYDINDQGQVVGVSTTEFVHTARGGAVIRHAFLWQDGHSIDLDDGEDRSRLYSGAYAVNNQGQVVGWRQHELSDSGCIGWSPACPNHATLWVIEAR